MTRAPDVVVVALPPQLVAELERAVVDYAAVTKQELEDCRRLVEIAVLTRGLRSLRDTIANDSEHLG